MAGQRRRFVILGSLVALFTALHACTFEDGNPAASASGELTIAFDVADGRVDDAGRIRTANDYRIELHRLSLEVGPVELVQSATAADVSFDPANPPAGYSLCHNGHCHNTGGELVDYDEIIAMLSDSAGVDATRTVVLSSVAGDIWSSAIEANFEDCPNRTCPLTAAPLTGVDIAIASIRADVSVADSRSGDGQRVQPYETELDLAVGGQVRAILNESIEYRGDNAMVFAMDLSIPADVLDAIDWATLSGDADAVAQDEAAEAMREALEEHADLAINVQRRPF